jgi:hypothetical protein
MIDLEESYYDLKKLEVVHDCDHGRGESYEFSHNGKNFAFTFYAKQTVNGTLRGPVVSLLDVTN